MNDQSGYHKRMAAFGFSCGFGELFSFKVEVTS